MTHSLTTHGSPPFARALRFEIALPSLPAIDVVASPKARKTAQRRGLGLRNPLHALLADAHGVWAWAPHDRHAPAVRHASVADWMRVHPGTDMHLWVSGHFVRNLRRDPGANHPDDATLRSQARRELIEHHGEGAANWPLATWKNEAALGVCALDGLDLEDLNQHARRHGVRMHSVVPWWYHAFQEARRCVNALNHALRGQVCVVEGRQLAWIDTAAGQLAEVRQTTLSSAHVGALGDAIQSMTMRDSDPATPAVVLGQGLEDGARTHGLKALVLGRLDGQQPPQWLRPSFQENAH